MRYMVCIGYEVHGMGRKMSKILRCTAEGGSQFLLQNRLGKVAKDAFSSGVETTLPCEQVTIGVTSFGELLSQRRSQRRPKQKRDLYSTECIRESQRNKET